MLGLRRGDGLGEDARKKEGYSPAAKAVTRRSILLGVVIEELDRVGAVEPSHDGIMVIGMAGEAGEVRADKLQPKLQEAEALQQQ